jgi:CheY-like chemotaxis protein
MRARQKNLQCDWTISDHVPTTVLGDGHRLQQILTNLVGNAIKFTSHGSVNVVIDSEQNGPHWNRLHVKVIDTGVGIPKNKQKTIFDAFSQADYSTTRNFGGTGLGLAITTQLVELMGGTMTVDSMPGQGSTFHFTANFGVCETQEKEQQPEDTESPECRPLNVLLAEDNRVNQRFAQRLLEKQGHQVTIAEDGRKAVELTKQIVPDVVLMDIQMPELDGYQATQAIRRLQANGMAYVPIVAMTAHAMKGDREKCLEQGMDDYVTKPVRKAELFRVLANVTSQAPAAASP